MSTLNRDGIELYYEVHGEGPALLLTHGYSATSQMWRPQIEALAREHTLILWDMRGHGRSAAPENAAAYGEAVTTGDMAALLQHLGFERAIVGGLSLGGYMSLAFYADHPEMVDALLIIDTGPGFKKDSARAAWNETAEQRARAIEDQGAAALEGRSLEQATAEHRNIRGLVHAARYMLTQRTPRVIELLPDVRVPTLVLAGADDTPFLAATDYMAAKIPDARKVVIPGAGHASNLDQPQAFNRAVLDFLKSVEESRPAG
jgi:pimeloyl-ACP methyl ester carboxylesterase